MAVSVTALPSKFASVNPKYMTPGVLHVHDVAVGLAFFLGVSAISDDESWPTRSLDLRWRLPSTQTRHRLRPLRVVFPQQSFESVKDYEAMSSSCRWSVVGPCRCLRRSGERHVRPDYGYTVLFGIGGVLSSVSAPTLPPGGMFFMLTWNCPRPRVLRGAETSSTTPRFLCPTCRPHRFKHRNKRPRINPGALCVSVSSSGVQVSPSAFGVGGTSSDAVALEESDRLQPRRRPCPRP